MGRWQRDAKDGAALIVALAVHAGVFLGLGGVAPPPLARAVTRTAIQYAIELDIVQLDDVARDGPAIVSLAAPFDGARSSGMPRRHGATVPPHVHEGEPAESAATDEGIVVAPGDEYGGPPEEAPRLPGFDAPPVWAFPGAVAAPERAPAPTAPPSARPPPRDVATQVLRGTLGVQERDKGMEVPLGGILARSFADSARRTTLPHDCRATYEVRVAPDGSVTTIRHVSATSGDSATWQRVGAGVKAALSGRALPVAGRASRGAVVAITVVSRWVYPSGTAEPQMSDIGSNKSDVIHATYAVSVPGERPLPPGAVKPIDTRSPFLKGTPRGVAPVEIKSHDPGR